MGLDGLRVLSATETVEVVVVVETSDDSVGCVECGLRAEDQDHADVEVRDSACFGRPVRLVWRKRRWRCVEPECEATTWTECSSVVSSRQVLTRRAVSRRAARVVSTPGR
jgi:transposase